MKEVGRAIIIIAIGYLVIRGIATMELPNTLKMILKGIVLICIFLGTATDTNKKNHE